MCKTIGEYMDEVIKKKNIKIEDDIKELIAIKLIEEIKREGR